MEIEFKDGSKANWLQKLILAPVVLPIMGIASLAVSTVKNRIAETESMDMEYARLTDDGQVIPTDSYKNAKANKFIKQEYYKDFYVSSVFLPIDHSFGDGIPIHFETMVFASNGEKVTDWCELWGRRAHTREECLQHHQEAKGMIDNGEITKPEAKHG